MTTEYIMVRVKPLSIYLDEEHRENNDGMKFNPETDKYEDFTNPLVNTLLKDLWLEKRIDDDKIMGVLKLEKNTTIVTKEGHFIFMAQGYKDAHYAIALEPDEFVIMGEL